MRGLRASLLGVLLLVALGCGPDVDPYCTDYDDDTGFGVALCRNDHEQPVCDLPGETARFVRSGGAARLVGGRYATCNEHREVVCAALETTPYCLPELVD